MRILSISTSRQMNNYRLNNRKKQPLEHDNIGLKREEVSFKGNKAAAGSVIGTMAGIGFGTLITLGTGGLAAPLLAAVAGCASGSIAGDIMDAKDDPDRENANLDPTYPNCRDY